MTRLLVCEEAANAAEHNREQKDREDDEQSATELVTVSASADHRDCHWGTGYEYPHPDDGFPNQLIPTVPQLGTYDDRIFFSLRCDLAEANLLQFGTSDRNLMIPIHINDICMHAV